MKKLMFAIIVAIVSIPSSQAEIIFDDDFVRPAPSVEAQTLPYTSQPRQETKNPSPGQVVINNSYHYGTAPTTQKIDRTAELIEARLKLRDATDKLIVIRAEVKRLLTLEGLEQ